MITQASPRLDLLMEDPDHGSPQDEEDLFQLVLTKACMLQANLIRAFTHEDIDISSIKSARGTLYQWSSALPGSFEMARLCNTAADSPNRSWTYYIHLFHLGAMMRLFSLVLSNSLNQQAHMRTGAVTSREAFESLMDGVFAAQLTARTLRLMRADCTETYECLIYV